MGTRPTDLRRSYAGLAALVRSQLGGDPLTRELRAIVKALEGTAVELVEKLNEAARQAEIERLEWLAAEERRRQEEDRRQVQQSVKDSQAQLAQTTPISNG